MIRIGIVGCGRILNAHLQGYRQLREAGFDNFRITALYARNRDDALMFRKRGEGPTPRPPVIDPATKDPLAAPHIYLSDFQPDTEVAVFTDYKEMIDSGEVDAVNDFTTLHMHHQIGEYALHAGNHLLTQKPLTISVKAGRKLVELADKNGLTFGVFENVRQSPGIRAAHWVIREGYIGEPQMAVLGSVGGFWSPDKIVAETPWRHRKLEGGGGGAIDIGVHVMHMVQYVVGDIFSVQATVRTFEPVRHCPVALVVGGAWRSAVDWRAGLFRLERIDQRQSGHSRRRHAHHNRRTLQQRSRCSDQRSFLPTRHHRSLHRLPI